MSRLGWMIVGASAGLYGRHKAKKAVDTYVPPVVSASVAAGAQTASQSLKKGAREAIVVARSAKNKANARRSASDTPLPSE